MWMVDDYFDFVKSAVVEIVRRITQQVLSMECFVELLESFVKRSVAIERESFPSREARESVKRVVDKYILDRLENVYQKRDPVAEVIVLLESSRR